MSKSAILQTKIFQNEFLKTVWNTAKKIKTLEGTSLNPENNTFNQKHIEQRDPIICKTSQNPYPCLFYSIYNARRNLLDISEKLKELQESRDFYINGIPLFKNEDDLKWSFAIWAHNGGNRIIKEWFPEFIKNLKDNLKIKLNVCRKNCPCQNNQSDECKKCLNRCKFKSLTTSELHTEFSEFSKKQKITNATEVSDFMNKINKQLPALADPTSIQSALNHLHPDKENNEEMKTFIKDAQQHCPISINQIFDYN